MTAPTGTQREVMSLGDRLRARRRAERGEQASVPTVAVIVVPVKRQRVRLAMTQPTDATEPGALKALKAIEQKALATCLNCGTKFPPKNGNQIFCEPHCRRIARSIRERVPREPKSCAWCGEVFGNKKATALCCSERCREQRKNARERDRKAVVRGRTDGAVP